jgi:hypothetical protein
MTAMDYSEYWNRRAIEGLLQCEPGLVTADQLSYEVMRTTECIRGRVRAVLRGLVIDGILKSFDIRHRDAQMDIYDIDDEARELLRELLGSVLALSNPD